MTFRVGIDMGQMVEVRRRLASQGNRFERKVDKVLRVTATETVRRAKLLAPVGVSGHLRGGINATPAARLTYIVSPSVHYGPYVERGRNPSEAFPPPSALLLWVKRKGIVRSLMAAYRAAHPKAFRNIRIGIARTEFRFRRVKRADVIERFERSAAFLVARAIYKKGIKPRLFMARAAEYARVRLRNGIADLLRQFSEGRT